MTDQQAAPVSERWCSKCNDGLTTPEELDYGLCEFDLDLLRDIAKNAGRREAVEALGPYLMHIHSCVFDGDETGPYVECDKTWDETADCSCGLTAALDKLKGEGE